MREFRSIEVVSDSRRPDAVRHLGAVPAVIADDGERSTYRFVEFFTAGIRNPNTRRAYFFAAVKFFDWARRYGLTLGAVRSVHVAAYVEELLTTGFAKPTVKQHLAAIRMLFDWLVVGQVVPINPAAAVRGPKHVVYKGKTPVLTELEARQLLRSIDTSHVVGLRDRAIIGVMVYTFARVHAVLSLRVEDYFPQGKRWWLRLQEKNAKVLEMPAHHKLEEYLDSYLEAAAIGSHAKSLLFRTTRGQSRLLTERPMRRTDAWRMVRRRAYEAGILTRIGCHSFRATGITNYLEQKGSLEIAQRMAGHSSAQTTKLYDRRDDRLTLDEVERISI